MESWQLQPSDFCFPLQTADRHPLCIPGMAGLQQLPSAGKQLLLQTCQTALPCPKRCTVGLGALERVLGRKEFKNRTL